MFFFSFQVLFSVIRGLGFWNGPRPPPSSVFGNRVALPNPPPHGSHLISSSQLLVYTSCAGPRDCTTPFPPNWPPSRTISRSTREKFGIENTRVHAPGAVASRYWGVVRVFDIPSPAAVFRFFLPSLLCLSFFRNCS